MSVAGRTLFRNARIATMNPADDGLGTIDEGGVLIEDGRIAWVGPEDDMPAAFDVDSIDCEGRWITPGLVDCHTHLVYAGTRAREFEMRLAGATYEDIARAGGGIVSSVKAVREASESRLLHETLPRLDALIASGVTTVEVKSGYGLDRESETKALRVARDLPNHRPVTVRSTFLGAHAVPPEFREDPDAYVERVINDILPVVVEEGLADAVDAFCEGIAFSPDQVARVFEAARQHGLPVKLHADQLSDLGGGSLAARFGALSADHLEHTSEQSVRDMADAGTVAVLLPGAYYFLRETQAPPVEQLRQHRVPMAVATDANPGTSPLTSMLLTMNLAATMFGLTVDECLLGSTRVAARALGMVDRVGTIEEGKRADLAIWDIDSPAELVYNIGLTPLWRRVHRGVW